MDIRTVTLPIPDKKNLQAKFQIIINENMTSGETSELIADGWMTYNRLNWREWKEEDEYPLEAEAARQCGVKDGEKFAVKFEYIK